MTKQVKTVLGFCSTYALAEEAVDKLRLSGFRNTDVAALMRDCNDDFGSVLNWPAGSDISKQEAYTHADWINGGGVVLCVRCASFEWERRAERVLQRTVMTAGAC